MDGGRCSSATSCDLDCYFGVVPRGDRQSLAAEHLGAQALNGWSILVTQEWQTSRCWKGSSAVSSDMPQAQSRAEEGRTVNDNNGLAAPRLLPDISTPQKALRRNETSTVDACGRRSDATNVTVSLPTAAGVRPCSARYPILSAALVAAGLDSWRASSCRRVRRFTARR